jgi:hypothetical protein
MTGVADGSFDDAWLERRCVPVAARHFGKVRTEDLARLPPRVVIGVLDKDGLGVKSEDEVYRAVAGYVEARDRADSGGGGRLCEEERRGLWGCCRFAYCSAEVQGALARLPEAAGVLGQEYLLGVVAERMARERIAAGGTTNLIDGEAEIGETSSQIRPRQTQQVLFRASTHLVV